jgi:hypothetical protein
VEGCEGAAERKESAGDFRHSLPALLVRVRPEHNSSALQWRPVDVPDTAGASVPAGGNVIGEQRGSCIG